VPLTVLLAEQTERLPGWQRSNCYVRVTVIFLRESQ